MNYTNYTLIIIFQSPCIYDDDEVSTDESELDKTIMDNAENEEISDDNESQAKEGTVKKSPSKRVKKEFVSPGKIFGPKNKRRREDTMAQEAYEIMKTVYERKGERDEYALFSEQVACKLRKLSSDRVRSNVQHIINTVLWEAECGGHENYNPLRSSTARQPEQNHQSYFSPSMHGFHAGNSAITSNPSFSQHPVIQNPNCYPHTPSPTSVPNNQSFLHHTAPINSPSLSGYSEHSSENEEMHLAKVWSTL